MYISHLSAKFINYMDKQSIKQWVKNLMPRRKSYDQQQRQQFQVTKYQQKNEEWTSAQAEIINQLIHMDSLIKITKHLNYEEFIFLKQTNQVLCLQSINKSDSRKALLGGINVFDSYSNKRYITKQLPFQYYSVRSLLWKINIGYLPRQLKQKWVSTMQKNYAMYRNYVRQLIVHKKQKKLGIGSPQIKKTSSEEKNRDHPLNFSGQSKWKNYFEDVQIWTTIQKDVKRTRKNCKFFEEEFSFFDPQQVSLKPEQLTFLSDKTQTYADCLTRILFIYIKNNHEVSYTQGMNEIVATILYSLTNKNSVYMRRVSESDSYLIFTEIMSRFPKRHFQRGQQYAKKFSEILKKVDLRLHQQLQKTKMIQNLQIIAIRWLLTGFLSQFEIDDSLIIWDCVICWSEDISIINTFMYIGLALIHLNRNRILEGENLLLIFSKIENSPFQIVSKAINIYKIFPKLLDP